MGYSVAESDDSVQVQSLFEDARLTGRYQQPPTKGQRNLADELGSSIETARRCKDAADHLYRVLLLRAWVYSVWRNIYGFRASRYEDLELPDSMALGIARDMYAASLFTEIEDYATTDAREGDVFYRISKSAEASNAFKFASSRFRRPFSAQLSPDRNINLRTVKPHSAIPFVNTGKLSRELKLIKLRQSARQAYDLMRLGPGSAERLCAALMLGSVFFGAVFSGGILSGFDAVHSLMLAGVALFIVFSVSAVLILGPGDDDLATARVRVSEQLAEARTVQACRAATGELVESGWSITSISPFHTDSFSNQSTRRCPYCAEHIQVEARKCKHCGELLDEDLKKSRNDYRIPRWNPGVAAVLSLVIPGAGQMYKGQVLNGLIWLVFVAVGYLMCLVPGVFLHLFCILGAASGDPNK